MMLSTRRTLMLKLVTVIRHSSLALEHIIFKRYSSNFNAGGTKTGVSGGGKKIAVKFLKSQQQITIPYNNPVHTCNTLSAVTICIIGLTFLAIPLYELFCQKSGYLGTPKSHTSYTNLSPPPSYSNNKKFVVDFVSQSNILWKFYPCQDSVIIRPGETTLAFYKAKNLQPTPIIGIATYNVIPDEAGQYFNKIQCFCFEEQMLNPSTTLII